MCQVTNSHISGFIHQKKKKKHYFVREENAKSNHKDLDILGKSILFFKVSPNLHNVPILLIEPSSYQLLNSVTCCISCMYAIECV